MISFDFEITVRAPKGAPFTTTTSFDLAANELTDAIMGSMETGVKRFLVQCKKDVLQQLGNAVKMGSQNASWTEGYSAWRALRVERGLPVMGNNPGTLTGEMVSSIGNFVETESSGSNINSVIKTGDILSIEAVPIEKYASGGFDWVRKFTMFQEGIFAHSTGSAIVQNAKYMTIPVTYSDYGGPVIYIGDVPVTLKTRTNERTFLSAIPPRPFITQDEVNFIVVNDINYLQQYLREETGSR
jgi:hypothetical protein